MSAHDRREDVGAYVLGTLDQDERARFAEHLEDCQDCRREVAELRVVVDALPLAAVQVAPPQELEARLMSVVRAEADLLRASGAGADEPLAPAPAPRRPWWRRPVLALRPLPAALAAAALLAIGVTAGILASGGHDTRTVTAQVRLAAAPDATAALLVDGGDARLRVHNFPAPARGHVYQVWLKLPHRPPVSGRVLFTVPRDGSATVDLHDRLRGVEQVMVTSEPRGGSTAPTTDPVIVAAPA
jgi:anti-sigma-K factor RskA